MQAYVDEVRKMERRFDDIEMEHMPRGHNGIADKLSKMVARKEPVPSGIFIERLTQPYVDTNARGRSGPSTKGSSGEGLEEAMAEGYVAYVAESGDPEWATDILHYLCGKYLPKDNQLAEQVA